MSGAVLIMFSVYVLLVLVRSIRWTAILQQKEYRLDRLKVFIESAEGVAELLHVIPTGIELTRTGFKRPKITLRSLVSWLLILAELSVSAGVGIGWYIAQTPTTTSLILVAVWLTLVLFLVPVFVMLTAIPTSLIARYRTTQVSRQAGLLLATHSPLVIGITGSYGKSSTKQLLAHVLGKKYTVFATPRSFNTRLSVAQSVLRGYSGQKIVILEYGAYGPREIERLAADLPPSWAVITGFAPQHVGLFGSEDAIAQAKAELLLALPENGKVFSNADDTGVQRIIGAAESKRSLDITEYSISALTWLQRARLTAAGKLELPQAGKGISTQLVGKHYLQTIAGVWSVAQALGMTESAVFKRLESFEPSSNFVRNRTTKTGVHVIDDGGTSNPRGFAAALALLAELEYPQKVLVTPGIVDLGAQSDSIHRVLADQAWNVGVSEVLYVGGAGVDSFTAVFGARRIITERKAVETTLRSLPKGSVLLIEGRMPGWCADLLKRL